MEILTTLQELPDKLKYISAPPETRVRVIIEEVKLPETIIATPQKPYLPFLDDNDFWDSEDTPTDISVNIDKYVYE